MGNAELLKGKEYIDVILDLLQGKKDQVEHKDKRYCYHEIKEEDAKKLKENLSD